MCGHHPERVVSAGLDVATQAGNVLVQPGLHMSSTPAPAQAFVLELHVPATVAGLGMKAGMVPAQSDRKLHTLTFLTNIDERLALPGREHQGSSMPAKVSRNSPPLGGPSGPRDGEGRSGGAARYG
jgi:hypothetical protein